MNSTSLRDVHDRGRTENTRGRGNGVSADFEIDFGLGLTTGATTAARRNASTCVMSSERSLPSMISDIVIISKWPSRVRADVVGPVSAFVPM